MHPELSKRLTRLQLEEALRREGLFDRSMVLEEWSYPTFYVRFRSVDQRERLLRVDATDYDTQPVALQQVDPETREPLAVGAYWQGNFPGHPGLDGEPFICLEATRDYYTHPSHRPDVTGVPWEQHRACMRLVDVLLAMRRHFAAGAWR